MFAGISKPVANWFRSSTDDGEETESFMPSEKVQTSVPTIKSTSCVILCMAVSNTIFALLFAFSITYPYLPRYKESYEHGFDTDLQPARAAITLEKVQFYGGIFVNESGDFDLRLNPNGPKYTGKPTRELDAAWDTLVGNYLPLDAHEAAMINGDIDAENGLYFVVPHVRHSLHCVNYLRKALYSRWYPVVHEMRDNIPDYWMHVDHCIETLRETIACNGDLTPVPHVWSEKKEMYLANTMLLHTCRNYEGLMQWQDEWTSSRSAASASKIHSGGR